MNKEAAATTGQTIVERDAAPAESAIEAATRRWKSAGTTTDGIAAPISTAIPTLPEWIRLPKTGTLCSWTGLTRSGMNELVLPCPANDYRPPVRSVCLRKTGKLTGARLVHLPSLLAYLDAQAQAQPVVLPRPRKKAAAQEGGES